MQKVILNPLVLPDDAPLRRRHIVPDRYRLPGYDETYDFTTLAYDVVWMPRARAILLVCPKLLNLESLLKDGRIEADGTALPRPRIKRYRRHDEVWIACRTRPAEMVIRHGTLELRAAVSPQETAFDGANVLMTKSKDNALEWLTDWALHHRRDQGADAALLFDNGSTTYGLEDARHAIGAGAGIAASAAIASDFPFGSWKASKLIHRSMFYQAGMLNLARHRFLARARAALLIDIDELVCGESAFDAAVASHLGYVTMPSYWRYSNLDNDRMPRHADHIWRKKDDAFSKGKYALVPNRWFTRTAWDIHGIHRYAFNRFVTLPDTRILHCEHISTGWKRKRDAVQAEALLRDPRAETEIRC
ncbi:MAG: hypothetical protein AAF891_01650 [Pseudomonadota bacterium]